MLGPLNQSHLRLGYHQDYSWIQSHYGKPLRINPLRNRVGIGAALPDATLDVSRGDAPGGTALFRGSSRISHFNHSTDEHTYIRGGKAGSNVYLNDDAGNVAIGGTDPQGNKLFVNSKAFNNAGTFLTGGDNKVDVNPGDPSSNNLTTK